MLSTSIQPPDSLTELWQTDRLSPVPFTLDCGDFGSAHSSLVVKKGVKILGRFSVGIPHPVSPPTGAAATGIALG
jgi:hypothetical protein